MAGAAALEHAFALGQAQLAQLAPQGCSASSGLNGRRSKAVEVVFGHRQVTQMARPPRTGFAGPCRPLEGERRSAAGVGHQASQRLRRL
jgi:hypothetical protein